MDMKMQKLLEEFAQAIAEYAEVKYPVNGIQKIAEDVGFEIQLNI